MASHSHPNPPRGSGSEPSTFDFFDKSTFDFFEAKSGRFPVFLALKKGKSVLFQFLTGSPVCFGRRQKTQKCTFRFFDRSPVCFSGLQKNEKCTFRLFDRPSRTSRHLPQHPLGGPSDSALSLVVASPSCACSRHSCVSEYRHPLTHTKRHHCASH